MQYVLATGMIYWHKVFIKNGLKNNASKLAIFSNLMPKIAKYIKFAWNNFVYIIM